MKNNQREEDEGGRPTISGLLKKPSACHKTGSNPLQIHTLFKPSPMDSKRIDRVLLRTRSVAWPRSNYLLEEFSINNDEDIKDYFTYRLLLFLDVVLHRLW